jgi:hypothetical protein
MPFLPRATSIDHQRARHDGARAIRGVVPIEERKTHAAQRDRGFDPHRLVALRTRSASPMARLGDQPRQEAQRVPLLYGGARRSGAVPRRRGPRASLRMGLRTQSAPHACGRDGGFEPARVVEMSAGTPMAHANRGARGATEDRLPAMCRTPPLGAFTVRSQETNVQALKNATAIAPSPVLARVPAAKRTLPSGFADGMPRKVLPETCARTRSAHTAPRPIPRDPENGQPSACGTCPACHGDLATQRVSWRLMTT